MNFWEFADRNPGPLMFAAFLFVLLIRSGMKRFFRFMTILDRGWPPPHCDADGDLNDVEPNAKLRDAVTPNSNKETDL